MLISPLITNSSYSDGTGIQRSVEFHWLLGPLLMIAFAVLGNTLFLTILVSTLSNTFARITRYSTSEIQFRRAVLTFEGVKSDAIFAYQPPFNLLAVFILLPLKLIISSRWFHKVNITSVRIINAPLLLAIAVYERRNLWPRQRDDAQYPHRKSTSARVGFGDFSRFHVHGDLRRVFEHEPAEGAASPHLHFQEPQHILDRDRERSSSAPGGRGGEHDLFKFGGKNGGSPGPRRRASVWSIGGSVGGGQEDHLAAYMSDHDFHGHGNGHDSGHSHGGGGGHGNGNGNNGNGLGARLDNLEASMKRIEELLGRLTEPSTHGVDGED